MTPQIHLHVLASGSKGNASLVEGPGGLVLIDCGISRRSLDGRMRELGLDPDALAAVLVTHEHSDHVSGISVLCNRYEGPLFATAGTVGARAYLSRLPFTLIARDEAFELAGMRVQAFATSHDVSDPVGFSFRTDDDHLGFCTDTGVLTDAARAALAGSRILALESNHDVRMLAEGPYPGYLKARVGGERGHLSNDQAAEALRELVTSDTETVVAMHLSQKNNRPSLAVRALASAVGAEAADSTFTEARTPDGRLSICYASQEQPMTVW